MQYLTSVDQNTNEKLFQKDKQIYYLNDLPNTLQILSVPMNQISDITPISLLNNLQYINLSNNKIYNLQPLEYLPYVSILDLSYNLIYNISKLQKLKTMTQLNLTRNMISNISEIQCCNQLTNLQIAHNQLEVSLPFLQEIELFLQNLQGNRNHFAGKARLQLQAVACCFAGNIILQLLGQIQQLFY
ncbi:Conserved_hypothetical protein [Hexamita inflata]|uniref:Leucine-rich repeat protein n=1 Tax=Hexamita inflata TaxID=28002 RepID=A0AA86UP22_9EUKA|nr:Conserved hypothetical protein [Hexamita inflata]